MTATEPHQTSRARRVAQSSEETAALELVRLASNKA